MIEYNIGEGMVLVFYKKEDDAKYSFFIKNEEELTTLLLANCKTKRVAYNDIKYAVKGISNKIKNNLLIKKEEKVMENPIIILSEKVQRAFGKNIETKVVSKSGPDHCPIIEVQTTLPSGTFYKGKGGNKKEAAKEAAKEALLDEFGVEL